MADPNNSVVERSFSLISGPFAIVDDQNATVATGAGCQALALRVRSQLFCVTKSVANGAVILPSISNGNDAPGIFVIINETLVTINVGTTPGDTMNGVATTSNFGAGITAIPTKTFGIFLSCGSPFGKRGVATAQLNNWLGQAF